MPPTPFSLSSYRRAIIHIDADAFFASCEQASNPSLKGKPVVTGKERGIVSAASYEAKALGITRGMTTQHLKQYYPGIIHLPSDYETYSLYSRRMFAIVRRYTTLVEEYSIDECFAELTGLRRTRKGGYEKIAAWIKSDLETELGMTFSIGLAPSKVIAKMASKHDKPSGLVCVPGKQIHELLADIPIGDVWGIGPKTLHYLRQFNLNTALDFAQADERWVKDKLTKPHQQIWCELRGDAVIPLETEQHHDYKSISKTKTFTPPSSDRAVVLAQLSKNTENACIKARRHFLAAKRVYIMLRQQDFKHVGLEFKLSSATAYPNQIVPHINTYLDQIFSPTRQYRLTGIVLSNLQDDHWRQFDLFEDVVEIERARRLYDAVDALSKRYGKHTVFLGSSFQAHKQNQHNGERSELPQRQQQLLPGENKRQRIGLPILGKIK